MGRPKNRFYVVRGASGYDVMDRSTGACVAMKRTKKEAMNRAATLNGAAK